MVAFILRKQLLVLFNVLNGTDCTALQLRTCVTTMHRCVCVCVCVWCGMCVCVVWCVWCVCVCGVCGVCVWCGVWCVCHTYILVCMQCLMHALACGPACVRCVTRWACSSRPRHGRSWLSCTLQWPPWCSTGGPLRLQHSANFCMELQWDGPDSRLPTVHRTRWEGHMGGAG